MEDLIDNRFGRKQAITFAAAAAKAGILPQLPDLKAPTHDAWIEAATKLIMLVARRDLAGLKAFDLYSEMPRRKREGTSTAVVLLRYRDNAIAALTAQAKAEKRKGA